MSRRTELGLFWTAVVALMAAHMVSLSQGEHPLVFGWVPRDLAFRVVWMILGAGLVAWMTGRLWPDHNGTD